MDIYLRIHMQKVQEKSASPAFKNDDRIPVQHIWLLYVKSGKMKKLVILSNYQFNKYIITISETVHVRWPDRPTEFTQVL